MEWLQRVRSSILAKITIFLALLGLVLLALLLGEFHLAQSSTSAFTNIRERDLLLYQTVQKARTRFLALDEQANMWVGLYGYSTGSGLNQTTLAQADGAESQLNAVLHRALLASRQGALHLALLKTVKDVQAYESDWSLVRSENAVAHARAAYVMYVGNAAITSAVLADFASLNDAVKAHLANDLGQTQQIVQENMLGAGLAFALVALLGIAILVFSRRAVAPIPILATRMRALGQGDFDDRDLGIRRPDELGVLALETQRAATELGRLSIQTTAAQVRLEKALRFNVMLAQVNQIIATAEDATSLAQQICDVAVSYGGAQLACLGSPGPDNLFLFEAAAGATDYLKDIVISSDPDLPEGQGPAGRAWREGSVQFTEDFRQRDDLGPWREQALHYGIISSSNVPILRGGRLWRLLSFYFDEPYALGSDHDELLAELARDVSFGMDRLDIEAERRRLSAMQHVLLANTFAGIALSEGGRILQVNARLLEMLAAPSQEDLIGRPTTELIADERDLTRIQKLYQDLRTSAGGIARNVHLLALDGHHLVCDVAAERVADSENETVVWTLEDVTERHALETRLHHQAYHDVLTGAANRRALGEELPRAIARARRSGRSLALGILDLDDFKVVNDALGHEAGDQLLRDLAERLKDNLRASDYLARLGGDEFVVVLEGVEDGDLSGVTAVLERLHEAILAPYDLPLSQPLTIDASMGLALYPQHGDQGEQLLRQADLALYQVKAVGAAREHWYQVGAAPLDSAAPEAPLDPYGPAASDMLSQAQAFLLQAVRGLSPLPRLGPTTAGDDSERQDSWLEQAWAEHTELLLAPHTSQQTLYASAAAMGEMHALAGVDASLRAQVAYAYRQRLVETLSQTPLPSRTRYRLLLAVETRLQDDLTQDLRAQAQTSATYLRHLAQDLPSSGARWADVSRAEVDRLAGLPGIALVLMMRRDRSGAYTLEYTAGTAAAHGSQLLERPEFQRLVAEPESADVQGPTVRAWQHGEISVSDDFLHDHRFPMWRQLAEAAGVRSMLSIPVLDEKGEAPAGIVLYGSYTGQFGSDWAEQFSRGLKQRWQVLWQHCKMRVFAPVLPQIVADRYRARLFDGGFLLHLQPVLDLSTGRMVKMEALARLQMPDGSIVAPGVFLPLMRDAELDRIFDMGLDAALAAVRRLGEEGQEVEVSVNMAASTLLDPHCAQRVHAALQRHDLGPEKLLLELLETQAMDESGQTLAIESLDRLGVRLAIDDLGSGYSSLRRLLDLPFHTVKIDQVLLARLRAAPIQTISLVRALIQMSQDVGREVVVEGLEDDGMIELATQLGAPLGQGYGLGRPMPLKALTDWCRKGTPSLHPQEIHTPLGALAHHWRFCQPESGLPVGPGEDCPLTAYLTTGPHRDPLAADWHRRMHLQGDKAAARLLLARLTAQTMEPQPKS